MYKYIAKPDELSNLTPIILAGGKGTRLQSVISDRPKVLAPIYDRPFITYLLDFLDNYKFEKVIISIGYMADLIIEELGYQYKNISILYSREEYPLGTAGGVRLACNNITTDYCLILNGDSFVNCEINKYFNWFKNQNITAALYVTFLQDIHRFGSVEFDQHFNIKKFSEKGKTGSGYINTGIYLFKKELLLSIPQHVPVSLESDFFPKLCNKNFKVYYNEQKELSKFIDIGIPESYKCAEHFFSGIDIGEVNDYNKDSI